MKLFEIVSLGTNLCKGYSFEKALDIVKKSGFTYVEPSSIINMCEHVRPEEMTAEYASKVKAMLAEKGLKCYALSGHVDLTEEKQFHDFLKKIAFAGRIGAKMINTNSGPLQKLDIFYKNMKEIIKEAEKWDVVIGLESHGDIVSTAKDSVEIFKYFHHPLVRLNYDTGNTLFYSGGKVKVEEDIKYGFEYLAHLHLKDIRIRGKDAAYVPIGAGDVHFPAFFKTLSTLGRKIPCGYEIPVHVKGILGSIGPQNTPMPEEGIYRSVRESTEYVEKLLEGITE